MTNLLVSTVAFKSNLAVVKDRQIKYDKEFLAKIKDHFALEKMKACNIPLTPAQEDIYEKVSLHCVHAPEGDYPFGTVIENGEEKVKCKCENTGCKFFKDCRPDRTKPVIDITRRAVIVRSIISAGLEKEKFGTLIEKIKYMTEKENVASDEILVLCFSDAAVQNLRDRLRKVAEIGNFLQSVQTVEICTLDSLAAALILNYQDQNGTLGSSTENYDSGKLNAAECIKQAAEILEQQENLSKYRHVFIDELNNISEEGKKFVGLLLDKLPVTCGFTVFADTCQVIEKYLVPGDEEPPNGPSTVKQSGASEEQKEIIQAAVTARSIVNAGPGTGKTWTLIEKIKYMIYEQNVNPENILALCFSRAAVQVIRQRLKQAADKDFLPPNWREIEVRTFDSFATALLLHYQEDELDNGYDKRIEQAKDVLLRKKDALEAYKHIFVDEVQDLVGVRAEMVLALLEGLPATCGFTILGDSCQAIFDYLAEDNSSIMPSNEFYKKTYSTFPNINKFSLKKNFRQQANFAETMLQYRDAILKDDLDACINAVKEIKNSLVNSYKSIDDFTTKDVENYSAEGTLGILTRTNAQSLLDSATLRFNGIHHLLRKQAHIDKFAGWIAKVLTAAESDVISKEEFLELFEKFYPELATQKESFWSALISTQEEGERDRYEIEDLVEGLWRKTDDPLLYAGRWNQLDENIIVSNIHKAKGNEFDTVLLSNDFLDNVIDSKSATDLLEHKVVYVALTRAKKHLEMIIADGQHIYSSKDDIRRCYRRGNYCGPRYLSHFEIIEDLDFDERSFAMNSDIQNYIRENLKPDMKLKLIKCSTNPENSQGNVLYRIVPEEDDNQLLGYTTIRFSADMKVALRRIFNKGSNYPIKESYQPNILDEIYYDGLITCISKDPSNITGARKFGKIYIWNAVSASGFAQGRKY